MTQTDQNMYGLAGKFTDKDGKPTSWSPFCWMQPNWSLRQRDVSNIVSRDTQNENDIWITEVWDSKEDHDNSLQLDGVKELISKALPLIEGQPEQGLELEVIGGAGIGN